MAQIQIFNRKVFIKDVIIAVLIIALPFLFFLYNLVPDMKVWDNEFFRIDSNYYENLRTFSWVLATKLLALIFLALWFVTCKHWWRYAIIVPLVIQFYKLAVVIDDELRFVDDNEFLYSLPITLPIIFMLIYLSKKLNYFSLSKSVKNELDDEIDSLLIELSQFKTKNYKKIRSELRELKMKKSSMDKNEYLTKLIILRDNLIKL